MPSLKRGESSSSTNPVLDIFTVAGNPAAVIDVFSLGFRIVDISTPAKRLSPVQLFPATPGDFYALDPVNAPPTGHRLSVGHYFAPWEVPLSANTGDHRIEWQFQLTSLSPFESLTEEFFVYEAALPTAASYCSVADIRAEGFDSAFASDARIEMLASLATKYIDKMTGRWFTARTFDSNSPMMLDGDGSRTLHLDVPIIRLDNMKIESQAFISGDLIDVDPAAYRVYNRHLSGLTRPDDRENPRISFIQSRLQRVLADGILFQPRTFPRGRQNIFLEGVFGYTDPDGSPFGNTPDLIKRAACLLVIRDLRLDSDVVEKFNDKVRFRINMDKEGSTTVRLQDIWLKGAFTGDPEIDGIIMAYKRPIDIGIA